MFNITSLDSGIQYHPIQLYLFTSSPKNLKLALALDLHPFASAVSSGSCQSFAAASPKFLQIHGIFTASELV